MEQYNDSSSAIEDVSAAKLDTKLTEDLKFQHQSDITDTHNLSDQEYMYTDEGGDYEDEDDLTAEILSQSGYASEKHSNVGNEECICEDEEEKSELAYAENEDSRHSAVSWPNGRKLVSAFKGSREEGLFDREVRVTWAPDVYDPPITSDDHFPQNKTEKHRGDNKKQKNKQKRDGKSARDMKGKGKDKKQTYKHGGSSKK